MTNIFSTAIECEPKALKMKFKCVYVGWHGYAVHKWNTKPKFENNADQNQKNTSKVNFPQKKFLNT